MVFFFEGFVVKKRQKLLIEDLFEVLEWASIIGFDVEENEDKLMNLFLTMSLHKQIMTNLQQSNYARH
jgi:hypothetical protein